ncbi:MAG: vitamin K epoxide reductase family protein [Bdellovibrionales bacterium]
MENSKDTSLFYVQIIFALIGAGLLAYLTQSSWALILGTSSGESACNIGTVFNCDAVSASKYGSLFGIPLALFGALSYVAFLIQAISAQLTKTEDADNYSLLLSGILLGASIVMGAISITSLNTYCLFCILTYVASFIIFIATYFKVGGIDFSTMKESILALFKRNKGSLGLFVAIPIMAWFVNEGAQGEALKQFREMSSVAVADFKRDTAKTLEVPASVVIGASDEEAKYVITEYADFLCGHCKNAAPTLKAFVYSKTDVQLRFKNFPLSNACNDDVGAPDRGSCRLAATVDCAERLHKKGEPVLKELFRKQGEYTTANAVNGVSKLFQLDEAKMNLCVNSDETLERLKAQAKEGIEAGVKGTPTVFVNGKKIRFGARLPFLEAIYRSME